MNSCANHADSDSCRAVSLRKPNLLDSVHSVGRPGIASAAGMAGQTTFHCPTSPQDGLPACIEGVSETCSHALGGMLPVPATSSTSSSAESTSNVRKGSSCLPCPRHRRAAARGGKTVAEKRKRRNAGARHPFITAASCKPLK